MRANPGAVTVLLVFVFAASAAAATERTPGAGSDGQLSRKAEQTQLPRPSDDATPSAELLTAQPAEDPGLPSVSIDQSRPEAGVSPEWCQDCCNCRRWCNPEHGHCDLGDACDSCLSNIWGGCNDCDTDCGC